ncbi:hypothetical protein ABPG72_003636 [Tetrahymena utriculariae]
MNSGKILRQKFYHNRLPLGLDQNFDSEREFFWSEIIHTITSKDVVNQAGIAGSNIKQLIVKFKNVYGLKLHEQQLLISLLLDMLFTRKNVRTDSKVLLFNFLNEMLSTRPEFDEFKLDWKSFYEFYLQEFHNNEEKPYRNEQNNISLFSEFIILVKRCKQYFDVSSIKEVYEIFKQNYTPSKADHYMNLLTLFLKIDQDAGKEVYEELLQDFVQYLNFSYCSRNTLTLYNIMKILREFKSLNWEKYYDEIFTSIFRNLNNLLILDTATAEENVINTLLPEEPIGVKSIMKQIPDFMVHLLLPSTHKNYEIVWQYIERVFLLIDRVFNPNAKSEQCDTLLKLFKGFVRKFIIRYDMEQKDKYNLEDKLSTEDDDSDIFDLEYNISDYHIPEYLQEKNQNKNIAKKQFEPEFILDETCKERFLGIMDKFLKKLIYMEDGSHSSCKILHWLCYFEPHRYAIPVIEHCLQSFSYMEELSYSTIKNIVLFIIPVLCDRKLCPTGLKYIPQFLKTSFKLFEKQGVKDNLDLVEAYSKIFMLLPIERYQDLFKSYKAENPEKYEKDFQELINDHNFDAIEFIQQLEIFAIKFFKLIVENIGTLDMADSESCTLIIDFNNIFWTFIVNSSHSLRIQYINILFARLEDNIIPEGQQAIAYLLDCLSLVEPEVLLQKTIELLEKKLVKKRTDLSTIQSMKSNVMWYFLEKNENKDKILEKEFAISTDTSIKYYVSILENAMSYSRSYIIKHLDFIETIAFLCFFQDDLSVFEKSCDIIHTVILTLGYIYPTDVTYLNKSERPTDNTKYQYLHNLGKTDLNKFQLEWYNPSEQEKAIIMKWLNRSLNVAISYFQDNYFSKPQYPVLDYEKDYAVIIHEMLFDESTDLSISKTQKDFYKVLYVALASFSGINVRIPFIKPDNLDQCDERVKQYHKFYKSFESKFMFEELSNCRNELTDLCTKLPSLFHHTKTIQDASLIELYQYISRECFGESYLIEEIKRSNEMIDGLCVLNDFHRPNLFNNRFSLASECITYLNEKIDMFFFLNPYLGKQKLQLFNSFFILSFHPTYLFRMSIRFDHDLNFSLTEDNEYESMHKKAFQIMNNYIFKENIFQREATPTIEKVQELLLINLRIESLQRFPCCAANPDSFYYIFNSVEIFEMLDKKIWQQKVIEQIMKTLTSNYEDAYLFSQLRPNDIKKCTIPPIIQSNPQYYESLKTVKINRDSISLEKAKAVREAFLEIINKSNNKMDDPKTHWKTKVLCGLFVVYFLNIFDDLNHPYIARFAQISINFATSKTDIHLAQYGRSLLFRLINIKKRRVVKKNYEPMPGFFGPTMEVEDSNDGEYTLEEYFQYHFLKRKDLQSYLIKSREIGTYYDYAPLYNKSGYEMKESDGIYSETIIKILLNENFFNEFIETIFEAKEIYSSDSDEQDQDNQQIDLSQGEVFDQIQILFNFTFDSDKKKQTLFNINLNFNLFEFYARLFKKIFQAIGKRFFDMTHKKIESLADDFNNLPRQRVISIYVWSLLKWIQRLSREERKPYMDFCVKLTQECVVNCSQELFRDWCLSISLASKNNSFDIIEEFTSRVLEKLKHQKGLGKRFRYHKLLKTVLTLNQTWARKYSLEGMKLIMDADVEDTKESDENCELFAEILCSCIISRINVKKLKQEKWIKEDLQQLIDEKKLIVQDDYTAFENNKLITQFIEHLFNKLNNVKKESKKKLYSHMTFKVLDSISVKRQNDLFWSYFRPFFTYIIDNKPENINDIEILKVMSCNEYPANIRKDIKRILAEKIESENWVSRQKVILFLKNFLYFEEYQENQVQVDNLIIRGLTDKNNSVSLLAVECLSEILKLATTDEQNTIFQKYKSQSQAILPKDKNSEEYKQLTDQKQIAVQVLMSLLLAFQEDILPWTEEALREVINSKTLNANMRKKVKEFVGQYWREQDEVITFNSLSLSEKIKKQIREIANPYDYFA